MHIYMYIYQFSKIILSFLINNAKYNLNNTIYKIHINMYIYIYSFLFYCLQTKADGMTKKLSKAACDLPHNASPWAAIGA